MAGDKTTGESANLSALSDLCTPWCIHVVATLRVADHLAAGTTDITTLAQEAGCDTDSLQRVLRHLVSKGVFAEPAPGRFALNEAALRLLDPAQHLGLDLTGTSAYHEIFGLPFWDDLEAHPDIAASFDALMGPPGHGTPDPEVLVTGGWEEVKTVVDVGGGTGALLAEILRTRPAIHGTLVDLPRTVAPAQRRSCGRLGWVNGPEQSGRASSTPCQQGRISISSSPFSTTGQIGKPG